MADNIDQLAGKILELGEKFAEPAAQTALAAARMEAISCLVGAAVCFFWAVTLFFVARKLWAIRAKDLSFECEFPWRTLGGGSCFMIAVVCAVSALWSVADPWTWATLTNPELWLAKKALGL